MLVQSCGFPPGIVFNCGLFACGWPVILTGALLVVAACAGFGVLWWLALATKRRAYERIGPEGTHLARVRASHEYHLARGLTDVALDAAVVADLREQLLDDYAQVVPLNRELTLQRYHLRALAVSYLLWSLFAAITATILIVVTAKFGLLRKGTPP
jgi:hypothetical protein